MRAVVDGKIKRYRAVAACHIVCIIYWGIGCSIVCDSIPTETITGGKDIGSRVAMVDCEMQRVGARTTVGISVGICVCSRDCVRHIVPRVAVACCGRMVVVGSVSDGEVQSCDTVAA